MSQRIIDLTLSVLATVVAVLLSWPFWRTFDHWTESHLAWWIYFAVGSVLSVYVFYIFIGSQRMLFTHDAQEQAATPTNEDRLP